MKARPHAHIYDKWVRGIRTAVPDCAERCALYEYIIAYQIAKIYGAADIPEKPEMSQAAAVALAMLEGDLEELCDARREHNEKRQENGAQAKPSRTKQNQVGANRTKSDQVEPINTIQSNTIQNNTKQEQKNAPADANAFGLSAYRFENAFALGLALLRKGYIIDTGALESDFERINAAKSPFAYAVKALDAKPAQDKSGHASAVNFVEATGCKDCRALGVYALKRSQTESGAVDVLCTACARDAIGSAGLQAAAGYLQSIGANKVNFVCNGCN